MPAEREQQTRKTDHNWNGTVTDMASALGSEWKRYYFNAYVIPNLILHTTGFGFRKHGRCDGPLLQAITLFHMVIKAHNFIAELNLYDEIGRCGRDIDELSDQIMLAGNTDRQQPLD